MSYQYIWCPILCVHFSFGNIQPGYETEISFVLDCHCNISATQLVFVYRATLTVRICLEGLICCNKQWLNCILLQARYLAIANWTIMPGRIILFLFVLLTPKAGNTESLYLSFIFDVISPHAFSNHVEITQDCNTHIHWNKCMFQRLIPKHHIKCTHPHVLKQNKWYQYLELVCHKTSSAWVIVLQMHTIFDIHVIGLCIAIFTEV